MAATLIYRQLCERNGLWHLVSWDPEQGKGSLIVGNGMPREADSVRADAYHVGIPIESFKGIAFYPELRYWDMKVYPSHWHRENAEPLLLCRLMGGELVRITTDLPSLHSAFDRAHKTGVDADHKAWSAMVRDSELATADLHRRLIEDGWEDHGGDGLTKYVHVDDLDKIEGPPPEGAF